MSNIDKQFIVKCDSNYRPKGQQSGINYFRGDNRVSMLILQLPKELNEDYYAEFYSFSPTGIKHKQSHNIKIDGNRVIVTIDEKCQKEIGEYKCYFVLCDDNAIDKDLGGKPIKVEERTVVGPYKYNIIDDKLFQ